MSHPQLVPAFRIENSNAMEHRAHVIDHVAPRVDRRTARRHSHAAIQNIPLTLPGRRDGTLRNISTRGALIDTSHRLCPGRTLEIAISLGRRRVLLPAIVVRAALHAIHPEPVYRVALHFYAEPLDLDFMATGSSPRGAAVVQGTGIASPVTAPFAKRTDSRPA